MVDISRIVSAVKQKVNVEIGVGKDREVRVWFPTGVLALDWIVSKGKGFPGGRVVEIYGDYSSGKSYISYKVLAQAQRKGCLAVLIDTEESFSKELSERAGIDLDRLVLVRSVTVEEGFEVVKQVLGNSEVPVVIVWDSLAATPTEHELEEGVDTRDLTKAMVVGKGLRYVVSDLAEKDSLLVFLNQVREKIGVMYGETTFAPGGRAVGFHASIRMELHRIRRIVNDDRVVGFDVRAKVVKNRVAEPFKEVEFQLRWDRKDLVVWWEGLFDLLLKEGLIEGKTGWYNFKGDDKKWRAGEFLVQLMENSKAVEVLERFFEKEDLERYLVMALAKEVKGDEGFSDKV